MPDLLLERWVEFGVAGTALITFAVSVIKEWLVPGKVYRRECERSDRLEEENTRIRDRVEEQVVPLVRRAIDALERDSYRGHGTDRG